MEYSVSILIPTYNRSFLFKRAINSSLEQTFNCELIVCDYGSHDDWMQPEYIEKSVNMFNEIICLVFCEYQLIDLEEQFFNKKVWDNLENKFEMINIFSQCRSFLNGLITPSCALLRKFDVLNCMNLTNNLFSKNSYSGIGTD